MNSQNKEELLVDARDAGSDTQGHNAAPEPDMNGFEQFPKGHRGTGQKKPGKPCHPLDRQGHRHNKLTSILSGSLSVTGSVTAFKVLVPEKQTDL